MAHRRLEILGESGFVVLDRFGDHVDPSEWLDLAYVDWKSSGDDPAKPDKDGVEVPQN